MKILVIYPEFPKSFWNSKILRLGSKKVTIPPRELLEVSILLPITWDRKLIDMNSKKLKRSDLDWADYIFIRANEGQSDSTLEVIERCSSTGKKMVGIGKLFTGDAEEYENLEHLVLDDFKITLPLLIYDFEHKNEKKVYHSNPFFEIRKIMEPYYSLAGFSGNFSHNIELNNG